MHVTLASHMHTLDLAIDHVPYTRQLIQLKSMRGWLWYVSHVTNMDSNCNRSDATHPQCQAN